MKSQSFEERTLEKSMKVAVEPPTKTCAPVVDSTGGTTELRSSFTSVDVARLSGAEDGYAFRTAAFPDGLMRGAPTETTSGVRRTAVASWVSAAVPFLAGSLTTRTSGPLKPGPKPLASRS